MARLRIRFLGGFELFDLNEGPVRLPSRNAAALLSILAVGRGRMQSRAKIANLLWESRDFDHARGSLRQTLFLVRRLLGREALREQTDALRLDESAVQVDIWDFADLLDQGTPAALLRAVDLYQGDLLDGHRTDRSPAFDEWLSNERQQLRDAALNAFGRVLDRALQQGAYADVQRTAARVLAIEPVDEAAHRALMQVHARERRFGQAMRQFERCRRILQSELNVEPDAMTRQLHADIVRTRTSRFPFAVPAETSELPTAV